MASATRPGHATWPVGAPTAGDDAPRAQDVPRLGSGDRLSADEFERRYEAMPGVRAELIEGVAYVASPVSVDHSEPHLHASFWLGGYLTRTPYVAGGVDGTIRLDVANRPQPDGYLRIRPEAGGRCRIGPDRYIEGSPEFLIEIARSTVSYDLHDKLEAYRRNGVLDYVIWRADDQTIDWFTLRNGRYEPLARTREGHFRSEVLAGLWLDPSALLRGDPGAVWPVVQEGLASPEHAAFVERLKAAAPSKTEEPRT